MKQQFIPKEKLSKKARKALDREQRQTWGINPVSRKSENKKHYNRKRSRFTPDDGESGIFSFFMLFCSGCLTSC